MGPYRALMLSNIAMANHILTGQLSLDAPPVPPDPPSPPPEKTYGERAVDDIHTALQRRFMRKAMFGDYTPEQVAQTYRESWTKTGRQIDQNFLDVEAAALADPDGPAWKVFMDMVFSADIACVPFDTSDPDRSPTGHVQTWKDRQRETARLSAPFFEPRHMSRAQRRKQGDFRTARQIIADDIATMRRG